MVYDRAADNTRREDLSHLQELATRVAGLSVEYHHAMTDGTELQKQEARQGLANSLRFIRDNDTHTSRIYSFSVDDSDPQLILDTNGTDDTAEPLPEQAKRARQAIDDGAETTQWTDRKSGNVGFAVVRDGDKVLGAIGVESDVAQLEIRIASIRRSFAITCVLGLLIGVGTGSIVWKSRLGSAHAIRALEEDRKLEDATFASLGEVVYRYDVQEERFRWRANTMEVLGIEPSAIGESKNEWIDRIHPDDQLLYIAALRGAVLSGRPMSLEYRVNHGDGRVLWLSDRSQSVHLLGDRLFLVGSLIDITERRNAEEPLRLFFDETPMAHMIFDEDVIIDANPAAASLLGVESSAELLERHLSSIWPRRQRSNALSTEEWAHHVHEAIVEGVSRFEWIFTRADGTTLACDVFLRDATLEERPVILMACHDITPVKLAQAQLIESEQRFRDISESIGEFVWEVDAEGKYVYVSSRVREVFGAEPGAVIGHHPIEWVPEEHRKDYARIWQAIAEQAQPFRDFEHRVQRADGQILWVATSGMPNFNSDGTLIGFRGASLDVTKRRNYEDELVFQKNAAEAADVAKSSFLAMMSHEIRTPLNSVLGFADLMLDTHLTDSQRDFMLTIKRSGDALLVVINDVLDFTKIESGRMEVEARPTDICDCVQHVLEMYRPSANMRMLNLTASISGTVPSLVKTDPARLRQILINLVGNAVKFTERGAIDVSVWSNDETQMIEIRVTDTGIGINESQRDRLFKPFSQADSSTTRRFGGTGLGLVISQRLAVLLGGNLELAETSEAGSQFLFTIPNVAVAPEEIRDAEEPGGPPAKRISFADRAPVILVVDDNSLNRRLTSLHLRQLGAEVASAASATDFFELRDSNSHFDLVLMDVQMPDLDGLEATRRLREIEQSEGAPRLPVIALTANAMVGDRERCLAAGMDGYLSKPLRRDALARLLAEFFSSTVSSTDG